MTIRVTGLAIVVLLSASASRGGPYSDLIVFGDSLSDVGNTNFWTAGAFPGSNYFDGRFSNGPTYAERLSEGLGLGALTRDGEGGDNFAYGGAETDGPGGFEGLFLNSFVEQVDDYLDRLDGSSPPADTLFVVFIGANDYLRGGQTNAAIPAGVVQTQLNRLINAGAETFLGINLPLLGLTPDKNSSSATAAEFNGYASSYNEALASVYSDIDSTNPGVTIHRLDAETQFNRYLADAASLGFTNTTEAGRDVSGGSLDGAPGYVFWDGVHPTREAHALLGEAAIRAVLPEGDYDRDGIVNLSDGQAWRDAYGAAFNASLGQTPSLAADGNGDGRVDAADYTLWRDRFVESQRLAVPEPRSWAMLLTVVVFRRSLQRGLRHLDA